MIDPHTLVDRLPPPPELERRCVALAALDALLCPEWELRYYSFDRRWDAATSSRMASMRDGAGDEYFILFLADGTAAIKGLAHESSALQGAPAVPGLFEGIPASFGAFLGEPAFRMDTATFGLWYANGRWARSPAVSRATVAADGSSALLALLVGTARDYAAYAAEYFEAEVAPEVVTRFFRLEPLTDELVTALYVEADIATVADDLEQIGYPVAR